MTFDVPLDDWYPLIPSRSNQAAYCCERLDHGHPDVPWVMCKPFLVDIVEAPRKGHVMVHVIEDPIYNGGYCEFRTGAIIPVGKVAKAMMRIGK